MDSFQILALMLMLACAYMLYCIRNIVLSMRDDTRLYPSCQCLRTRSANSLCSSTGVTT